MLRPASLSLSALMWLTPVFSADQPTLPPSPVGFTVDENLCASGGPRTHFFEGGRAVIEDCGEDCPVVAEGRWTIDGARISVQLEREIVGVGENVLMAASRTIFERYTAMERATTDTHTVVWEAPHEQDCVQIRRHAFSEPSTRHVFRSIFKRDYPEMSARPLTPEDLAGKSKQELATMRNEVFASYGHTFKNAKVRGVFEARPGYVARFVDVSALLTPIETANLELIRAAERSAR